jgi:hypothetical protein
MKQSLILATIFVASAGAVGAGAFAVSPYVGSDTEFNIQNQSIESSTLGNVGWKPTSVTGDYSGGGSGGAEAAMATGTAQQTGPMSRMLKGGAGANACASTNNLFDASGVVIGIDAARVFASASVVNTAAANGGGVSVANACDQTVAGLKYDESLNPVNLGVAASGTNNGFENWRDVLALLYGGLDKDNGFCSNGGAGCNPYLSSTTQCGSGNTCNPITDCTSPRRAALINNWSAFFENVGVTNANGSALTHAWRRDDNSGTSDVFSSLLGMQAASVDQFNNKIAGFAISSEAVSSFGTSPYCNALNWDTAEAKAVSCFKGLCSVDNATKCTTLGAACTVGTTNGTCIEANDRHFVGPGGVALPNAQDGNCNKAIGAAASALCHHVPVFTCGPAPDLCPDGSACSTVGAACANGGTCQVASDNRCPAGQTIASSVYGSTDFGTQAVVFPTSYQDNDPLRTPCSGTGARAPAEDVCNTDGKLGVVLPIPPLDFVADQHAGLLSYTGFPAAGKNSSCQIVSAAQPTQCTNGSVAANAPSVYTCAPKGTAGNGLCPNNDGALSIGCLVPAGLTAASGGVSTTQCWSVLSTSPGCFFGQLQTGGTPCGGDGRIYNEQVYDGTASATGTTSYINFTVGGVALNDTGAYARIHQKDPMVAGLSACQLKDATQQIGCLTQADPSSMGYGGNTGDIWESADPLAKSPACSGETAGLRVHEIAAGAACLPLFPGGGVCPSGVACPTVGAACADASGACIATGSYPIWRKLYMNSIVGFGNITAGLPHAAELELAGWESEAADIDPIMLQYGEFQLPFSPNGVSARDGNPQPFCEDLNEYGIGCPPAGGTGNQNACCTNTVVPAISGTNYPIPSSPSCNGGTTANPSPAGNAQPAATTSTVCGNGILEEFEDCDPGTPANGTGPVIAPAAANPATCGTCSNTCRCSLL